MTSAEIAKSNAVFPVGIKNPKSGLNQHRPNPVGYPYYCPKCNKGYNCKTNYKVHMDKHAGIRYQCNFCPKIFAKTQDGDDHLAVHTGNYPFKCNVCGKDLLDKTDLRRTIAAISSLLGSYCLLFRIRIRMCYYNFSVRF